MFIGSHLSIAKGFGAIAREARAIGADTFAFFLRNPRGGIAKMPDPSDIDACKKILQTHAFGPLVAHAPYVLNPCAAKPELRIFSRETMIDDLHKLDLLPGNYYNFHPGSHVGQGSQTGIQLTGDFLNDILPEAGHSRVLIETMAGKGSEIGKNFEEIAQIMESVRDASNLGVCLDTCHVWDGGYDIAEHLDDVLAEFDSRIGLCHLYAVHLNDSMNDLGSHKDRHQKIGQGKIGLDALRRVSGHPKLCHLPFILETPNDLSGYAKEIRLFR